MTTTSPGRNKYLD